MASNSVSETKDEGQKCDCCDCFKFDSEVLHKFCGYEMNGYHDNIFKENNMEMYPISKEPGRSKKIQLWSAKNSDESGEEYTGPRIYEDIGLKKCSNGHFFHMSRTICPECKEFPISYEIDYESAYDLEDEVFESGNDGPNLDEFGLILCVKGHIRHKRTRFCKYCPKSESDTQDGDVEVQNWLDSFDSPGI